LAFAAKQPVTLARELDDTVFSSSQQRLTTAESQTGSLGTFEKAAVKVSVVFRLGYHGVEFGQSRRGSTRRWRMGQELGHEGESTAETVRDAMYKVLLAYAFSTRRSRSSRPSA
jgi:hypothetical protein